MTNKYKTVGPLGNTIRIRTDRSWIIAFPDDEVKFKNLRLAFLAAKAAIDKGLVIKVYEETLMRFKKNGNVNDEKFRIEITERIKLMIKIEQRF